LGHFVADPTTAANEVTAVEAGSLESSLEALRPTLLAIARMQLRNETWAEDVVSETFVAALEGARQFAGQSQLKTWVVGILKHKIIDQFRRSKREVSSDAQLEAAQVETFDELFAADGHRLHAPLDWGDPEESLNRTQFFDVLQMCVDKLPAGLARIFMMREWLDYETDEICKELGITSTNCFVMLFRARMRLRECLEMQWFGGAAR
jgi:RNA polymerase sigma-70 factor (TIGR02943 family)